MDHNPTPLPFADARSGTAGTAFGPVPPLEVRHNNMNTQFIGPRPFLVFTRWWQLAILAGAALMLGVGGQAAMSMYLRHNAQHQFIEQFIRDQQQFNSQVVQALQPRK